MIFSLRSLCTITILLLAKPAFSTSFPPTFTPFTSIVSETSSSNGNLLILGYTSADTQAGIDALPVPSFINEQFTDALVQLAPSQYFSSVYIPTSAERTGDYSSFAGTLIDPLTNAPFPGNIIPFVRLFGDNGLYAMRVGPQAAATPEPSSLMLFMAGVFIVAGALIQRMKRSNNTN